MWKPWLVHFLTHQIMMALLKRWPSLPVEKNNDKTILKDQHIRTRVFVWSCANLKRNEVFMPCRCDNFRDTTCWGVKPALVWHDSRFWGARVYKCKTVTREGKSLLIMLSFKSPGCKSMSFLNACSILRGLTSLSIGHRLALIASSISATSCTLALLHLCKVNTTIISSDSQSEIKSKGNAEQQQCTLKKIPLVLRYWEWLDPNL